MGTVPKGKQGIENKIQIWTKRILMPLLAVCAFFYLYTAWAGQWGMTRQRGILLVICLITVFMATNRTRKRGPYVSFAWDLFLSLLVIISYIPAFLFDYAGLEWQIAGASTFDIISGCVFIALLLEGTRRALGMPFTVVGIVCIVYAKWGNLIPGPFRAVGTDWERLISYLIYGGDGVYGIALYVASTVIIIFVLFGALLQKAGGSLVFESLPQALFGTFRGGPAKVSVIGSSVMGMMSGSSAANVATTGAFTIPMMKRVGYAPKVAAAIETSASCGGQFMPPIMGAVAFIMADVLQVSYWEVVLAAFVPAVLFYLAVFMQVDLNAGKLGLKGVSRSKLPSIKKTVIRCLPIFIPIIVLMYFLGVARVTAQRAGLFAIIALIIASWFGKETKMTLREVYSGIVVGMQMMILVGIACGTAGIVIGAIGLSGLGVTLSSNLISLAHGNVILLLGMVAVTSIVLGMGLTTTPCYLLLAFIIAPALVDMGIEPMAAHLFILYYGCLSQLTPPSAIAAYTAAGIAGSQMFPTAFSAMRLSIVGFIVPFFFALSPNLILIGSPINIAVAILFAVTGVIGLAISLEGYFWRKMSIPKRLLIGLCGLFMLVPLSWQLHLILLIVFAFTMFWEWKNMKLSQEALVAET